MLLENVVMNEVTNGEVTNQFLIKHIFKEELEREVKIASEEELSHSELKTKLENMGYTIKEVASLTYYVTC